MHIEPGIVDSAKMALAYGTAAAAGAYTLKLAWEELHHGGPLALAGRALVAAIGTFVCFEVLPHVPVGVSEVHLILGTTLMRILGPAAAAIGLALGLLVQGLFFAPTDLPMYAVNVTTLLAPLFAMTALARRIIPEHRAYVDLRYVDVLRLSLAYQGGIVAWVAFWALYGQGLGAENLGAIGSFGVAYMLVVLIEPLADLAALAIAKSLRRHGSAPHALLTPRLYHAG